MTHLDDRRRFAKLAAALGMSAPPLIDLKLVSESASGEKIQTHEQPGHSYTRNFYNIYFIQLTNCNNIVTSSYGVGDLIPRTTSATTPNFSANGTMGNGVPLCGYATVVAGVGVVYGVVIGTGTGAENFEDTALGAVISSGTGAGQMSYVATSFQTAVYDGGSKTWTGTLKRVFNNNSSGTIVVGETGIYARCPTGANGANVYTYMIERTKLSSTISVLAGGQLTVTYSFSMTFPA